MRLKTITLNNFRCFENLRVELHPRLTVVVGENGAGKTALLDGIASALTPVFTHLSSAAQRLRGRGIKDTDFRMESFEGRGGKKSWKTADYAQLMVETFTDLRWDYWRSSGTSKGKAPSEKWGETALKEHLQGITASYTSATPALTPTIAYYGASRGHIEVPDRLRSTKQNYDHPTAALVDCINPNSNFREMLAWFDLEESSELRKNKGHRGEDYEPFGTLQAVRAAVVSVLGGAYRNPSFNDKHKFMLERSSDGAPLLVNQLSQGYQSMLALAMDFARRLAIANSHLECGSEAVYETIFQEKALLEGLVGATPEEGDWLQPEPAMLAPAIMLVDEVDLHLHPSWQQRVLEDLMHTFPLTQFIVTTHSPQVLSTVRKENIRVLEMTEHGYQATTPAFSPLAHESGDALSKIMGTNCLPPLALLETVHALEQHIRTGQENSGAALQLQRTLDAAGYQIHPSDLATWRFLAQYKSQLKT